MIKNAAWNEAESFDALWDQYGDLVFNLAIRLSGSAKDGWLLARSALLVVRQNMAAMEGRTPTLWLYEITLRTWSASYVDNRPFWKRWLTKKKYAWELNLPDSVDSSLMYLTDRQEAILHLLKLLDYRQRMMAILRLADGFADGDIRQLSGFRKSQINKFTRKAAERLSKELAHSGVMASGSEADRTYQISAFLRDWKPVKAPLSLKADVVQKRIYQKQMQQEHIANQYSLKGIIWVWFFALAALFGSLSYFYITGRQMRDFADARLMRLNPAETSRRTARPK